MRALKPCVPPNQLNGNPVTTQAHEGIETAKRLENVTNMNVTTQAHEGIETHMHVSMHLHAPVTTQAHEGIETKSGNVLSTSLE